MLVPLLLGILLTTAASGARVWPVQNAAGLSDAVQRAESGDTIELDSGDYAVAQPLVLKRALTVRSRNRLARAVLRSASPDGLVFVIAASDVVLSDVIVGAQTTGISDERSIDVYVGAGTQLEPFGEKQYGVLSESGGDRRRSTTSVASRAEIAVARAFQIENSAALQKRAAQTEDLQALHSIVVKNVDFSASRSAANLAFGRGAYASVRIEQCVFGRRGAAHINALVGVAEARFSGLLVQRNTFAGSSHILLGVDEVATREAIGANYWPDALASPHGHSPPVYIGGSQHVPTIYCLDALCVNLAPVVDADTPTKAYTSIGDAVAARVRRILITDDIEISAPVFIVHADTIIEGAQSANKAPLITIKSDGALVSVGSALLGLRNVRFALAGSRAAALVYTDGIAQKLTAAPFAEPLLGQQLPSAPTSNAVVLLDGISVLGDSSVGQVALIINAVGLRVELEDCVVVQTEIGAVVHRGALVMLDTTVFGAARSGVLVETSTRAAGLRVSSSSFIGCGTAIETGGTAGIAALQELYVSCSQFLFNVQRDPLVARECVARPTLCSAALRYNSIISDQSEDAAAQTTAGAALRHLLRQGSNHFEGARVRSDYVYYGTPTHMRFKDDQGRFESVTAQLLGSVPAAFVLASYAPVVDACFAVDFVGSSASVVSDVFEVRSDNLLHSNSDAIAVQFRTSKHEFAKTPLFIYTVAHLGTDNVVWTLIGNSRLRPDSTSFVIDATLGSQDASRDKHAHRIVVVALGTPSDVRQESVEQGVASSTIAPRVIAKRLCVVCGEGELPARHLDRFCDGSTGNVRRSFDAAYKELEFGRGSGAPRRAAASIYVYGVCATEQCTVRLDQNENIEGTSSSERGTLYSTATECGDKASAFIDFLPRASAQASLRNMLIRQTSGIDCAIGVQPSPAAPGPIIVYNTISGALCIDSRSGGLYANNDIAAHDTAIYVGGKFGQAGRETAPIILEANVLGDGSIVIDGGDSVAPQPVVVERTKFATRNDGVRLFGNALKVTVSGCKNIGVLETQADSDIALSASNNEWSVGVRVTLQSQSVLTGGVFTGATIKLAGTTRLVDARIDGDSSVAVDGSGAVVLRNVTFTNIANSLQCEQTFASCSAFELAVTGIDLSQSTVFAPSSDSQVLKAKSRTAADDASAYWTLQGAAARCSSGTVTRNKDYCGCEKSAEVKAAPHLSHRASGDKKAPAPKTDEKPKLGDGASAKPVVKELPLDAQVDAAIDEPGKGRAPVQVVFQQKDAKVDARPLVDDDSSLSSSSSTLLYVLLIASGAILLLCCVFVCVKVCWTARTVVIIPDGPEPVVAYAPAGTEEEESDPFDLTTVRQRKVKGKNN
jgi:hypothetical protein